MNKTLKALTTAVFLVTLLLISMPVMAANVTDITWEYGSEVITPADTLSGSIPDIPVDQTFDLEVNFSSAKVVWATLSVVPVSGDAAAAITAENAALIMQGMVENSTANFRFSLKPGTPVGVYALQIGGNDLTPKVYYFQVATRSGGYNIIQNQVFQYDVWKEAITLQLDVNSQELFDGWAQLGNQTITLSCDGGSNIEIDSSDIEIDSENNTLTILTSDYLSQLPQFGGTKPTGNVHTVNVRISTPGYLSKSGVFGLVIPELSSEGFSRGVDLNVSVYADDGLTDARVIVGLYDNGKLVDCIYGSSFNLSAGATKNIPLTMQADQLQESNEFYIRIMLWQGDELVPLTNFIQFP